MRYCLIDDNLEQDIRRRYRRELMRKACMVVLITAVFALVALWGSV